MSTSREQDLTASFAALTGALAAGADVVDMLGELVADGARLLDVAEVGLLLADATGTLHVMAATSRRTRDLEVFQTQRDQGPCLDSYRTGEVIRVPDLVADRARWPAFASVALSMGFTSVHALPLRLHQRSLGALGLFGHQVGDLSDDDLHLGQALADVAALAVAQNSRRLPTAEQDSVLSSQLHAALASRVVVEQARGMVSQASGVSLSLALDLLRSYASAHHQRLSEVADDVVQRRLSLGAVAEADLSRPRLAPRE